MSMTNNKGFTIIESMLFLAITGLLIAGMIVGVGTSVTIQRYRDSVTTLKSFIQGQYSELSNITNTRDNSWRCDPATAKTTQSGITESRGQGDCVILGRYITIDGSSQSVSVVNGFENSTGSGNDISLLKTGYILGISTIDQSASAMEWGTQIAWPTSGTGSKASPTPRAIAILIIRSPDSGLVYTFTMDNPVPLANVTDTVLKSMLITGDTIPGQGSQTLCVDPSGLLLTSKSAVYIGSYATDQSAIETRSNDFMINNAGAVQC
jgi:type II secretory pathway pseudopilin PulG